MEANSTARFSFVRPTTAVTKAIVTRGRSRFAIVRPSDALPGVIAAGRAAEDRVASMFRKGGVSRGGAAELGFEAGLQFGASR